METLENIKQKDLIQLYLNSLSNDEKIILEIAKKQLESSFNIEKSLGFLKWKEINYKKI